ncbi:0dd6a8db-94a1-48f2-93c0-54432a4cf1b6-CDS [Sclerotinia trifoliorum]|uniref:0dd6a8db-94a1-48f2-93c0-54432a4cf1b6-CDS n=1 Tax=Sclerotinia trifoliorum TaxID=28548 RepID=A0A8H2W1H2_9HELO|nr:0dd6a8db-94a1-48f2-93c0-54432a4cf1b6-CDS [Sclerotinia trifoliorum]
MSKCRPYYICNFLIQTAVASISILLLRKTRMKKTQKLWLGVFLCLSFVMAIIALIRVGGIKIDHIIDNAWAIYWQYIEGCVACIMVSVVPFSTLFVTARSRSSGKKRKGPSSSLIHFWKQRKNSPGSENCVEVSSGAFKLPKPPNAILALVLYSWKPNKSTRNIFGRLQIAANLRYGISSSRDTFLRLNFVISKAIYNMPPKIRVQTILCR